MNKLLNNLEKLFHNNVKNADMVAAKKMLLMTKQQKYYKEQQEEENAKKEVLNRKMGNAGDILGEIKKERASKPKQN